jgi:asparagine synthase (glutamine-hydrolysing)
VPAVLRRALGRAGRRAAAASPAGLMRRPWAWRGARLLASADRSAEDRMIAYFWWNEERLRSSLLSPELRQSLGDFDVGDPLRASLRQIPAEGDPLNRLLYLETRHFLADHNLNYTDKVAMAAGVEVRVPLLDLELVAFAARLPARLKQRGTTGKYLFRRALEGTLPDEVIHRPKTGFTMPLRSWLRGRLRPLLEERLEPEALRRRGLFDPAAVRRLLDDNDAARVDGAYALLGVLCIESWCSMFLDGPAPASEAPYAPAMAAAAP